MRELFTLLMGLLSGTFFVVAVGVLYIATVATFGFALGLGWQAAISLWSHP